MRCTSACPGESRLGGPPERFGTRALWVLGFVRVEGLGLDNVGADRNSEPLVVGLRLGFEVEAPWPQGSEFVVTLQYNNRMSRDSTLT